jgi:hypothetical protein
LLKLGLWSARAQFVVDVHDEFVSVIGARAPARSGDGSGAVRDCLGVGAGGPRARVGGRLMKRPRSQSACAQSDPLPSTRVTQVYALSNRIVYYDVLSPRRHMHSHSARQG